MVKNRKIFNTSDQYADPGAAHRAQLLGRTDENTQDFNTYVDASNASVGNHQTTKQTEPPRIAIPEINESTVADFTNGIVNRTPPEITTGIKKYVETEQQLYQKVSDLCPKIDIDLFGLWDRLIGNLADFISNLSNSFGRPGLLQGMIDCFERIFGAAEKLGMDVGLDLSGELRNAAKEGDIASVIALAGMDSVTGKSKQDRRTILKDVLQNMTQNEDSRELVKQATGQDILNPRAYYHLYPVYIRDDNTTTLVELIPAYKVEDYSTLKLSGNVVLRTVDGEVTADQNELIVDSVTGILPGMLLNSEITGITDGTFVVSVDQTLNKVILSQNITGTIVSGTQTLFGFAANAEMTSTSDVESDMVLLHNDPEESTGITGSTKVKTINISDVKTVVEFDTSLDTGVGNTDILMTDKYIIDIPLVRNMHVDMHEIVTEPIPGSTHRAFDIRTVYAIQNNGTLLNDNDLYHDGGADVVGNKMASTLGAELVA